MNDKDFALAMMDIADDCWLDGLISRELCSTNNKNKGDGNEN